MLNALAAGILIFLLWDVLAHAWEPIDGALSEHHYGPATGNGAVLAIGFGIGLVGLVYFDRWVARRIRPGAGSGTGTGPGTASVAEFAGDRPASGMRGQAGQLAMLIAVGIGLHNFAEGLAIGNSAAKGELGLAVLLVIGFGTHNATEGFGIVAPMAATGSRPSWGYLALLGLIGGGPTFAGTLLGQHLVNDTNAVRRRSRLGRGQGRPPRPHFDHRGRHAGQRRRQLRRLGRGPVRGSGDAAQVGHTSD